MLKLDEIKVGDVITRIWGNGYLTSQMRVSAVDDEFIYCDTQNGLRLPEGSEPWKFDRVYGVETDEGERWSVEFGVILTRLDLPRVEVEVVGQQATFKVADHG